MSGGVWRAGVGLLLAGLASRAHAGEFRSFRELPFALESVTGVSRMRSDAVSVYAGIGSLFPRTGEVSEVSPVSVLATLRYGAVFCAERVRLDRNLTPADRWFHREVDFGSSPRLWSETTLRSVLREYASQFVGNEIPLGEENILLAAMKEVVAALPDSIESGPALLNATCSMFASSMAFLRK